MPIGEAGNSAGNDLSGRLLLMSLPELFFRRVDPKFASLPTSSDLSLFFPTRLAAHLQTAGNVLNRFRSKKEVAQVNEVLCMVLCHNICVVIQSMYELGIEPVFWSDHKKAS